MFIQQYPVRYAMKQTITKTNIPGYTWTCDKCNLKLKSLSEVQLEQWRDSHLKTHEEKGDD